MGNMGFADLARLRVRVVDDDPGFHKVSKTILRGVGVTMTFTPIAGLIEHQVFPREAYGACSTEFCN
jgi:hypothetical protein